MKKKVLIACTVFYTLIIYISIILLMYNKNQMRNTIDLYSLDDDEIVDLDPIEYIELPSQLGNGHPVAPTGISYNTNSHCFYIGNYGKFLGSDTEIYPGIIGMSSNFSEITNEVYFDNDKIDVQGIAYDDITASIWYTNGEMVVNCDAENGTEISSFSLGKYGKYKANGICIDSEDDSIWVLCLYKYLLHFSKDGILLSEVNCEYIGQDHICMDRNSLIYISVGVDYQGKNNFVVCIDENANVKGIYRVNGSYAIEGILIHGSNLYVVNDGIYHEAKIKRNFIQRYNIS